jgi:enamine deaminase RidA (YjgF/YER057c/UK114 family)
MPAGSNRATDAGGHLDVRLLQDRAASSALAAFAGITPNTIVGDIKTQTAQVLRRVDELLNLAGTDKSRLLSAQVWIADMRLFEDHNSVWNEWIDS